MFRRLLLGYRRALDFFERILMVICRLLFASVVLLYGIEIFTRYFLNYSSTLSGELGIILMTWMYFLGFVIIFKRGDDVVMEYFFHLFTPQIQNKLEWFIHVALLFFLTILLWKSIQFYSMTSVMEHPVLPIKYSYTVQPILVGTILAVAVSVYFLLEKIERSVSKANSHEQT